MAQVEDSVVRFGILGCASIARKVSRAILLTQGACLYALGSRSLAKAKEFAAANNFPPEAKIYGSYEEVLADKAVDAVYIPLPTSLHLEWVLKAIERKKHILLEKPPALNVEELDKMLKGCEKNGLQLMDATMWMHHPRAAKVKDILHDKEAFGDLKEVHVLFSFRAPDEFLKNNIRVKPDLDSLGALGDLGWYCARAALWAFDFELPQSVTALPGVCFNEAGVIMDCAATFTWNNGQAASFRCSFQSCMTMKVIMQGTNGAIELDDFVIPYTEDIATFKFHCDASFVDKSLGWICKHQEHEVKTSTPQEALMVGNFTKLVRGIRDGSTTADHKWPDMTRKTQQLLDAVKLSIEKHFCTIYL
ncbi:hypothetical protein O6H91_12G034200 [Diphasiastrum complanatum]|uniref:Uncharacterized protein n=1 Tax=Diphasiastrum complanatum TaxID=34168 RepID=A0ACC2C092_DIPCM|nr:hypothetical protein O6H91_12G034200 [Diphasiastrum complanatum]